MLLTRSRLCPRPKPGSSLHLHVLSTPPAFVLSQDQTLREVNFMKSAAGPCGAPEYTVGAPDQRRLNYFVPSARQGGAEQVESGRTYQSPGRGLCVHAVEFSKTGASGEAALKKPPTRARGLQDLRIVW